MYINSINLGNSILVRDTDGDYRVDDFQPKLFFPASKKTEYLTPDRKNYLTPISYGSIKEFKETLWQKKKQSGKVYGDKKALVQFMFEKYPEECVTDYSKVKIFNIDIEVDVEKGFPEAHLAEWPMNAITIKCNGINYVWGLPLNDDTFITDREDVDYREFKSERDLVRDFVEFWRQEKPHVVTGWNIDTFDIPYIYNRVKKLFGEDYANKLSPYGATNSYFRSDAFGRESQYVDLYGISRLDYLTLYKKFVLIPRENYKLDTIAEIELGEKKIDYSDYASLKNLYRENYQLFMEYNIKDVELVEGIDKVRNLIRLAITVANFGKVNYEDVTSPIRTWESTIYHHLMNQKIVPEIKFRMNKKDESFKGAFVIPPVIGQHKWILSEDFDSLYPKIIEQWNIGPETLVDPFELPEELQKFYCNIDFDRMKDQEYDFSLLKENNITICPSGFMFKTDKKSFFSELMGTLFARRYSEKKKMKQAKTEGRKEDELLHDTFQHAMKILLNSLYGALGSDKCQYFDLRLAESITKSGQLALLSITDQLNNKLKKHNSGKDLVIAGDTDSIYFTIGNIVDRECSGMSKSQKLEFVDQFEKQVIRKIIDKTFVDFSEYLNCYSNKLNMSREVIADNGFWCKKKRYALCVLDDEGYRPKEPKIKIMGLEIIKSSTPAFAANELKDIVKDILLEVPEQDVIKRISKFKPEFMKQHIVHIAENKGINYITKYLSGDTYKKGAQSHIRGAINFNALIKKEDIDLEPIYEGDKIKLVPLLMPNPIGDNMIAFKDQLPESMFRYIDYEAVWNKNFTNNLNKVTDVIGWSMKPKTEAAGLF